MKVNDYKTILYCQEDGSWVAEIPAISGCYALMPTRGEALAELTKVFEMIAGEKPPTLKHILDDVSEKAVQRGLTPKILDALLKGA